MPRAAAALLLALALAGCLEGMTPPPSGDAEEWYLGGAWTEGYTQADLDAWCDIAREYGSECAIMESYPPQFGLRFTSEAKCQEARTRILALEHITARECHRIVRSGDPDTPVSSNASAPPSDATTWLLHGRFVSGYNAADIAAWCAIAEELGQTCALMKSEPPQFSWSFDAYADCHEAGFRLQAIANATHDGCRELAPAETVFDVQRFDVTWSSPDRGPESMSWDVVRAWSYEGLTTVNVTTHGIEGGDFRFRLLFRPAGEEPLVHEPGAPRAGTFDFAYTEAIFWSGRSIERVASVDPASWVRATQDDATGALRGSFDLAFVGACTQEGCTQRTLETRLVGSFGP